MTKGIDDAFVQVQVDRYVEGYREGRRQALQKIEDEINTLYKAIDQAKNRKHPTQRWWGEHSMLNRLFEIVHAAKEREEEKP